METKEAIEPVVEHHSSLNNAHEVGNVDHGEVLETRYAGLSRWASVLTFWKAILFCMILNWAAMNDGVSHDKRSGSTIQADPNEQLLTR